MRGKQPTRKSRKWLQQYCKTTDRKSIFLEGIDCNLPYRDPHQVRRIFKEGLSISDEAVFGVMREICHLPGGYNTRKPIRRYAWKYLNNIPKYFKHPLLDIAVDSGNCQLKYIDLPDEETLKRMARVKQFPKLYSALQIVSMTSPDEEGKIDNSYDAILAEWHKGQ